MPAARIDGHRRQVADDERPLRQRLQDPGGAILAGKRQLEQPLRITLLCQQQALAARVPGQSFEALVARLGKAEIVGGQIGQIEALDIGLQTEHRHQPTTFVDDGHAPVAKRLDRLGVGKTDQFDAAQNQPGRGELDQLGVFAGHGEQRAGQGVPGQPGGFIILQSGQARFQRQLVVRQPDAGRSLLERDAPLLPEQPQLVIPVQEFCSDQQDDQQARHSDPGEQAPGTARRRHG